MVKSKFADRFRAIVDGEGTWVEKLDTIIRIKKDEDDLWGTHFSVFNEDGANIDTEYIAKGMCLMIVDDAEFRSKDITGEEL